MALRQVLNLTIIYIVIVAVTSRAWAASQHASDSLGYSAYGHGDSHCCWIISAALSQPIDRRLYSLPRRQALFLQAAAYTERSRLITLLLLLAGDVEVNPGPKAAALPILPVPTGHVLCSATSRATMTTSTTATAVCDTITSMRARTARRQRRLCRC